MKQKDHAHQSRRQRTRKVMGIFSKAARHKMRGDNRAMMTSVSEGLLELGGIYIKFLQGIMLQHPLMKEWRSENRYKIFEQVDPYPLDVNAVLRHQLLGNYTMLASLEREPFAAGSFGQVYNATLHDGRKVVVKVLRPHSRSMLKHDLRLLRGVSKLVAGTFTSWDIDFKNIVRDFTRSTFTETDYIRERQFADKLYHDFYDHPHIVIPRTYADLCTPNVLTQDYIGGISAVDVLVRHEKGEDVERYVYEKTGSFLDLQLELLGYSLLLNLFRGKSIHGDPHPGNVRFLPDNKVGLIDFGISAEPPKYRAAFYQLMKQYWLAESLGKPDPGAIFRYNIKYYAHDLYMSLQKISTFLSAQYHMTVDINKIIEEMALTIFKDTMNMSKNEDVTRHMQTGGAVNDVINDRNRFGLVGRMQDTDMMRSWITFKNMLHSLNRRPLLANIYDRLMTQLQEEMPELEQDDTPHISMGTAVDIMTSWLERVAQRDPMLFRQLMRQLRFNDVMKLQNTEDPLPANN